MLWRVNVLLTPSPSFVFRPRNSRITECARSVFWPPSSSIDGICDSLNMTFTWHIQHQSASQRDGVIDFIFQISKQLSWVSADAPKHHHFCSNPLTKVGWKSTALENMWTPMSLVSKNMLVGCGYYLKTPRPTCFVAQLRFLPEPARNDWMPGIELWTRFP